MIYLPVDAEWKMNLHWLGKNPKLIWKIIITAYLIIISCFRVRIFFQSCLIQSTFITERTGIFLLNYVIWNLRNRIRSFCMK